VQAVITGQSMTPTEHQFQLLLNVVIVCELILNVTSRESMLNTRNINSNGQTYTKLLCLQ
jgi:hypothetical protein